MDDDMNVIYQYTSKQAVEDGVLLDVETVNAEWGRGLFNYITTNLLTSKGYVERENHLDKLNLPNLIDLLNQANHIVMTKSQNFTKMDTFYAGDIELPSGEKEKIFIASNEVPGKYTIMLPEDY